MNQVVPFPAWAVAAPTRLPAPNVADALAFFSALYPPADGSILHMRGVPEPKDDRGSKNLHYALDGEFANNVRGFLEWCAIDRRAAFFLPGTVREQGTGKADVTSLPAILIDFDKGNPDANLSTVEELIGPATIVVESGGRTEEGAKLHAYWKLSEPATGANIAHASKLREMLALQYGGDPAFKQPAQVIRIPGSLHFKGEPKLVRLRTVRPDASYALGDLAAKITPAPAAAKRAENFFDFSGDAPHASDIDRVLTHTVHEGAVDELTRFEAAGKVIGHEIRLVRDGRQSLDVAWQAVVQWNAAKMDPPWAEDRLRGDFERLLKIDLKESGPMAPPAVPASDWARFDQWTGKAFSGVPLKRTYLIDGVLPLGVPGVVAAAGGLGKSYLMLDLALRIATGAPRGEMDFSAEQPIFGGEILQFGTAVLFASEDDKVAVHERLSALDPYEVRLKQPERLRVVPLPDAGGARALFAAEREGYKTTPEFALIRAWLKGLPDLKLVCFDPLQTFVAADITAKPEAGQFVMSALGNLAAELGATVLVTHHLKKTDKQISTPEEARAAIRGTTALVDGVRWAYALWDAPGGVGDPACVSGAVVKANSATDTRVHSYQRMPFGVLRQLPSTYSPYGRAIILDALEKAIAEAAKAGTPFTKTGANGLHDQRHRLPPDVRALSRAALEGLCQKLLMDQRVVQTTARGSKSRSWLDIPGGDFALGHGVIMSGAGALAA